MLINKSKKKKKKHFKVQIYNLEEDNTGKLTFAN